MRVLIGGLLMLVGAGASALAPITFNLRIGDGTSYTFMPVSDSRQIVSLYGSYQAPASYTHGTSVHIYPNRRFTVIEWCDICPDSLLAAGTYSFNDGVIAFSYTHRKEKIDDSLLPNELAAFHGSIQKKGYTTGSEYILINPRDVGAAQSDAHFTGYLRQKTWYPDWQSMYNEEIAGNEDADPAP